MIKFVVVFFSSVLLFLVFCLVNDMLVEIVLFLYLDDMLGVFVLNGDIDLCMLLVFKCVI